MRILGHSLLVTDDIDNLLKPIQQEGLQGDDKELNLISNQIDIY